MSSRQYILALPLISSTVLMYKRKIGVKLKNLFKNQFLLELSQKVKEIGSYLEIMSI